MKPANSRLKSTRLATFRSTVRQIESILHRSTISSSHAKQVKSKLVQLEGHFEQLLKWNRQLEAREVRGQSIATQLVPTTAATSRPNPLARLPDLCLLALFNQLPLLDQLTARLTCARWSTLMLEVTQTRRSLSILLDPTCTKGNYYEKRESVYNDYYLSYHYGLQMFTDLYPFLQKNDGSPLFLCRRLTAWSWLPVASLSATINQQIVASFCRVKKLELKVDSSKSPDDAEHLVSLVEQLGPHLEAFHLSVLNFRVLRSSVTNLLLSEPLVDRLYAAINSMSSLLHLNLELDGRFPHHDLPIISRLEELHFYGTSTKPDQFVEMLQRYGEGNGALRQIGYCTYPKTPLALFTKLSRRLRNCFTCFDYSELTARKRKSPCDLFRSLTRFRNERNIILTNADLAKLSQLTQLTVLRLTLLNFTDHWANQDRDDEASLYHPLPQLPSVALLHLQPRFRSHRDLDQLALPWTMPNLQVIYFDFHDSMCTDCHETRFRITQLPANLEPVKECIRQLFKPLMAQCTRLRLISHSEEVVLGTAEELLA